MLALTGATGYVGRSLLQYLQGQSEPVVTLGRSDTGAVHHRFFDLLQPGVDRAVLAGVHTLIHCAGLAHHRGDRQAYRRVNVDGTLGLAEAALAEGCRRFVFVSSLNVVPHEYSQVTDPAARLPCPSDTYSQSKWETERQLEALMADVNTELVVVRPALVYDRELVANLALLKRLVVTLKLTLPARGSRSMISRPDLVRLLAELAADEYRGPGIRRLAATDGECYDLARIGAAMARGWWSVPNRALQWAARCRDLMAGLPAGTHWRGLAGEKWWSETPEPASHMPEHTLETLLRDAA